MKKVVVSIGILLGISVSSSSVLGIILTPPANTKFCRTVPHVAVTGNGALHDGAPVAIYIKRDDIVLGSKAGNCVNTSYALNVEPQSGDWGVGKATIEEFLDSPTVTDTREIEFTECGGGGSGGTFE